MGDSIDIQQTITEAAMDTMDMKIRCDPSLKVLNKSEVPLWRTRLSHLQIARLVSQFFGKRHDEKKTLAEVFSKVKFQYCIEVFSKVKFQYCIDNEDHEILMMADYKEVIKGYTRTEGEITEEQQRDLIKIFEKRVAAEESQIRHDYFDMKKADKVERMVAFVSLAKVLANKAGDLKVRQSCPP